MQTINAEARRRFLVRYFISFSLVVLIPVALLGGLSLFFINSYSSREIESANRSLLKQTAYSNQLIFQTFDTVNLMVGSDINLVNSLVRMTRGDRSFSADDIAAVNALHNTLGSMIGSTRYIDSVDIYLKGAESFYSSRRTFGRADQGTAASWMARIDGANEAGLRFRFDEDTAGVASRFSVYRKLFNVNGIVVVNIDLARLRSDMAELLYHDGQEIYLLDGVKAIDLAGRRGKAAGLLRGRDTLEPGSYRELVGGERCLITVEAMERSDWRLVVLTPFRSLYGLRRRLTAAIAAVIGLCLLLGVAMAVRVEAANYRNIVRILDAIESAQKGVEPRLDPANQDVYTYILHRIIQNNILRDYMDSQMEKKKYLAEMLELKALQFQINPHFLVNTLKTIYWKDVETNGMDAPACRMMENLLDITGYSLADSGGLVTLKEEIRHSKSFAEILMTRHPNELEVAWDYDAEIESVRCNKLIIQPYIENAFYHGIRASRRRPGRIRVSVRAEGGDALIAVEDNGAGMDAETVCRIRETLARSDMPAEHIGIYNPHRRIVLTFGAGSGVSVESVPGEGTRVLIRFPHTTG